MYTRTFSKFGLIAVAALTLGGCGLTEDREASSLNDSGAATGANAALAAVEKSVDQEIESDGKIACAIGGATEFSRVCQIEQSQTDNGLILTVRHPDGGFRKLQVVKDGRGVIPADGADPATVKLSGTKGIEVSIAGNRYLLPATVKQPAAMSAANATAPVPMPPKKF
jgi:hypothetical protein